MSHDLPKPSFKETAFNLYPFAMPNCPVNEVRFEEPRDIIRVDVFFKHRASAEIGLSYLQRTWPGRLIETAADLENPCWFGWFPHDDGFNGEWRKGEIRAFCQGEDHIIIQFKGLTAEFPEMKDYDVVFRRTQGLRVDVPEAGEIERIEVYSNSPAVWSIITVELDCGQKTEGDKMEFSTYNAVVEKITPITVVVAGERGIELQKSGRRCFAMAVKHMKPVHRYCNDDGHITFRLHRDVFTISLTGLERQGPVWYAEKGIFIARAEDMVAFPDYLSRIEGKKTVCEMVKERPEQTYGGAYNGQPRPHVVSYNLACKHARQRFWLEANGDLVLMKSNVTRVKGKDTERFKAHSAVRFYFGLERWVSVARYPDPAPVLVYNQHWRKGDVELAGRSFAVPLLRSILKGEPQGDETIVALMRFQFRNTGKDSVLAEIPVNYTQNGRRTFNPLIVNYHQGEDLVPRSKLDDLVVEGDKIFSVSEETKEKVLRCTFKGTMKVVKKGKGIVLTRKLKPGGKCEVVLKISYISLESRDELAALGSLNFEKCLKEVTQFWRKEGRQGAQMSTPEPHLNALHASHLTHVQVTDFAMPDDRKRINTSVGTSTYGNFSNESCMIIHELDQRGLHEEARRRLELWIKYQGSVGQPGNFTDYNGMFFGAGGFEEGAYNQHHGWVLWCLCEHFFLTRDVKWFRQIGDSVIAGAEWVFRQRGNTMKKLPHSRGWEWGFLPVGSLEDVTDFHYWLSTNALTWRGTEWAARALEAIGHPEAKRVRQESDAYRRDLIKGFETMRQYSPLVRLRDGRWIPHYPSRLYWRGRDVGWIREVLEGAVYLLISGLFDTGGKQAGWILDDYQDNRYMTPPYGYVIKDSQANWFDCGGFSIQPNLLAGLLPYLDRDEPEMYIWMFFNAWCACYREEINAMIEHPAPILGYSNSAHFKTSDEANAINWLRYMVVYAKEGLLHFGRAIPRAWFAAGETVEVCGVVTHFGKVSIKYKSLLDKGKITADVVLDLHDKPDRILVRFWHPAGQQISGVWINQKKVKSFDAVKGDVEISVKGKRQKIEVEFEGPRE